MNRRTIFYRCPACGTIRAYDRPIPKGITSICTKKNRRVRMVRIRKPKEKTK